jgi:hypothetical protein
MQASSSAPDLHTQLLSLQLDCEAASGRRIRDARWLKRVIIATTVYSVVAVLAAVPMISWQLRKLDRVWRMRYPIRARNYQWAAGILCSTSMALQLFQISPIGYVSAYFACFKDSSLLDDVGMEARLLRVRHQQLQALETSSSNVASLEEQFTQLQKNFRLLEKM